MSNDNSNSPIFAQEPSCVKGRNMIAVISPNRSVGKTWFSITLAQALALYKQKVLLFDGDCGLNNVKSQLGLELPCSLDAVIYGHYCLNQSLTDYEKGHFHIISNKQGSSGISTMPIGRLQILGNDLNILSNNFDKTILDISSGSPNQRKVFVSMAKMVIILCSNTPQSITETYEIIRQIYFNCANTTISIVINQVNSIEEGNISYNLLAKACKEFLQITPILLGIIRQDTRIRDSIRNQNTIINRYPNSEASLDVINIAKRIQSYGQFD